MIDRGAPATSPPGGHTFLFVLRAQPDVDHISPLMWKCLEKGDQVRVIFDQPFPRDDFRLRFLARYPGFRILSLAGVESRAWPIAAISRRWWNAARFRALLRRQRIAACIFDWGAGAPPPRQLDRLGHLSRQLRTVGLRWRPGARDLRSFWKHDVRNRLFPPLRGALARAVRDLDLPAFCLPHGIYAFAGLGIRPRVADRLRRYGGRLPRAARAAFRIHVVNTEHYRQLRLRHYDEDPAQLQNWGSLRFSPEWRAVLARICPPAELPPRRPGQVRVVFLLPKWGLYVDKPQALLMLRSVAERDDVQLVLKVHPRRRTALDPETMEALERRPNVVLAGQAESQAVIEAADAGILLTTSLVVELFLQRKPVVYPKYLHANEMVFESHPGCLTARDLAGVHAWLDRLARREVPGLDDAAVAATAREFVFGDREPYDVPEYYYRRIVECIAGPEADGRAPRQPVAAERDR